MTRTAFALLLSLAALAPPAPAPKPGRWQPLFDGKTTAGWRGWQQKTMPAGWKVVDGALTRVDKAGDIVSLREVAGFGLAAEWEIGPKANSGTSYRVAEHPDDPSRWRAAPEYQNTDDRGYPEPLKATQKTAANYDLQPPGVDATKPAGEWNRTRILVNGAHVEHWLNGKQIVAYDFWTDAWKGLVAQSKFKDHPHYGMAKRGAIGIQDHGDWIAFSRIRVREF